MMPLRTVFFSGLAAGALLAAGCVSVAVPEKEKPAGFQEIVSQAGNKVFPAVVYINAVAGDMKLGRAQSSVVAGSGVLISPDGEMLTNWHVIDKAQSIRCLLNDGRAFPARIIGSDKDLDLALLKLVLPENTPPLPCAELAEGTLSEGDFVMAMGAPWGLNRSVSIGIISCASRYLPVNGMYSLWYQTDASISPGNSGGPLVDTTGRVVGINTLGVRSGGTVGFSIPSTTIRDVLPRLRKYGKVNWAWFGFLLQPLRDFNRDIYFNFAEGVIVSGTEPGSPARKAGFLPNDRILAVDGRKTTVATGEEMPGFLRKLGLLPFGKPVVFTVARDGKTFDLSLAPIAKGDVEGDESSCPRWGLTAKAINRFDSPNLYFYRTRGVYLFGVVPYGNAAQANLRKDDIILSVNGQPILTLADLKRAYRDAMKNLNENPRADFVVLRGGQRRQIIMDFSNDIQ